MKVLVCNAGSTSLKFKLFDMPEERVLATGKIERVGSEDNAIFHYQDAEEYAVKLEKQCIPTYTDGIQKFLDCLLDPEHRVLNSLEELERRCCRRIIMACMSLHQMCCRAWRIIW